jgi:hypothetical protein
MFSERWCPEPMSGCWLWMCSLNAAGYGQLGKRLAHRVSWEVHVGAIPCGLCVLHKCDTPPCVNPDHLWLGTYADNGADMARKGRRQSGPRKLSIERVAWIKSMRAEGWSQQSIANVLGVSQAMVSRVERGAAWDGTKRWHK